MYVRALSIRECPPRWARLEVCDAGIVGWNARATAPDGDEYVRWLVIGAALADKLGHDVYGHPLPSAPSAGYPRSDPTVGTEAQVTRFPPRVRRSSRRGDRRATEARRGKRWLIHGVMLGLIQTAVTASVLA